MEDLSLIRTTHIGVELFHLGTKTAMSKMTTSKVWFDRIFIGELLLVCLLGARMKIYSWWISFHYDITEPTSHQGFYQIFWNQNVFARGSLMKGNREYQKVDIDIEIFSKLPHFAFHLHLPLLSPYLVATQYKNSYFPLPPFHSLHYLFANLRE